MLPDDFQLFRDHVGDVVPIKSARVEEFHRRPPPRPLPKTHQIHDTKDTTVVAESKIITDQFITFFRPGIQIRVLEKLRQGQITPQLELDLHGLRVADAEATLDIFLKECRQRKLRCICIIHGKGNRSDGGQSILKCKVNYWLRCYTDVLAFTSAPRWDGGTGAVYVLLRNPNKISKA